MIKIASEEGFIPRKKEAECYFAAGLTPYFYIGELNGQRIGCISVVKHGDFVAVGGYYIVTKPYRGLGYGQKLFDYGWPDSNQYNIQTFSLMYLKDHHQKRGVQPDWMVKEYELTASHAVECLASCQLPNSVKQICQPGRLSLRSCLSMEQT